MARRSRAREVALQVLYADDLNPDRDRRATEEFIQWRLRNHDDLVLLAESLVSGVRRNRDELDQLIAARAANWTLERMAVIDRNILRIGAYEILYTDTPGRVSINEAIELAKRFGGAQSPQFVNGVLDRILHDLRRSDT